MQWGFNLKVIVFDCGSDEFTELVNKTERGKSLILFIVNFQFVFDSVPIQSQCSSKSVKI